MNNPPPKKNKYEITNYEPNHRNRFIYQSNAILYLKAKFNTHTYIYYNELVIVKNHLYILNILQYIKNLCISLFEKSTIIKCQ